MPLITSTTALNKLKWGSDRFNAGITDGSNQPYIRRDIPGVNVNDPNPIKFDRKFSYEKNGVTYIKDGVLIKDFNMDKHPLGYLSPVGRLRNYGGNK